MTLRAWLPDFIPEASRFWRFYSTWAFAIIAAGSEAWAQAPEDWRNWISHQYFGHFITAVAVFGTIARNIHQTPPVPAQIPVAVQAIQDVSKEAIEQAASEPPLVLDKVAPPFSPAP